MFATFQPSRNQIPRLVPVKSDAVIPHHGFLGLLLLLLGESSSLAVLRLLVKGITTDLDL